MTVPLNKAEETSSHLPFKSMCMATWTRFVYLRSTSRARIAGTFVQSEHNRTARRNCCAQVQNPGPCE